MNIKRTEIENLLLISPFLYSDDRGVFRRSLCTTTLFEHGINFITKQGNISENLHKFTMRGFHYQIEPSMESKLITCITGSIYNVVIDLRKDSNSLHKWCPIEISSKNKKSIFIPAGCANAFLTLENNTTVHYYMGDNFNPKTYKGFRYNDKYFNVKWPYPPNVISEKDSKFPDYIP